MVMDVEKQQIVDETRRYTVEEFWGRLEGRGELIRDDKRIGYELIDGEEIDVTLPYHPHVKFQALLTGILIYFVLPRKLGEVFTEYHAKMTSESMLVPDVCFVSNERWALVLDRKSYLPFAPDLAIEISSPGNSVHELKRKITLYFGAGARLVWVIYPDLEEVEVHHPDRTSYTLSVNDVLTGDDVLPGLQIKLSEFFAGELPSQTTPDLQG